MLPRILIALLALAVMLYGVYRFKGLSAKAKQQFVKKLVIIGLVVLFLGLAITGKLHWIAAAIGALLTMLPRIARFAMGAWPAVVPYFRRYQQNKQSNMQTRFISMQINILNGELQGEVLEGQFKGQKLQAMSLDQLSELLEECQRHDTSSAALLASYMQRAHPGWSSASSQSTDYAPDTSKMSAKQARDILGLSAEATKEEIIKAHKRLMQKMHPDRGGSDYLAVQINLAKEVLLKLL